MISSNRLLCIFASIIVFGRGMLAYKSGDCSRGYCFIISDYNNSNELINQSDAQKWCQSNGTQLVEIRNKDIQDSLVNFTRSQGLNGWNVLTNGKLSSSSKWLRLNGGDIGEITVNDEIDSSFVYGYLGSTTSGFDLFASRTTYNKGYICTGLSDCSGGVTINGQCYKSFTESLSWYEARNRCLNGGGDLPTFDNITSNAGFKALNGSWISSSNSYWIGIKKESWTWQSSNSDVKYTEWLSGHPRNYLNCLCLSTKNWKWIECNCTQQSPVICMTENSTKLTTPMTSHTIVASSNESSTIAAFVIQTTLNMSNGPAYESNRASGDAESIEQSTGLNTRLTVGLGIGIPVIIIIVLLAVIIAVSIRRRRQTLHSVGSFRSNTTLQSIPQQTDGVDTNEFNDDNKDPHEAFQSDKEDTTPHYGLYPTLDQSAKTDIKVVVSDD